jgi:hypothetical protein
VDSLNKRIILLPCDTTNVNDSTGKLPADPEDGLLYKIAHQPDYFITSDTKDFKRIQNSLLWIVNEKAFNKAVGIDSNSPRLKKKKNLFYFLVNSSNNHITVAPSSAVHGLASFPKK